LAKNLSMEKKYIETMDGLCQNDNLQVKYGSINYQTITLHHKTRV